ncbi:MAG: hypothetical protein HFG78_15620 [Hungatella sp.]|nr:hypothetical protein [Hungatella sp.]MCI9636315.1 hypothetical protein [Hungatella sp.]
MKKYSICTALVLVTAVVCFFAGYLTTSPDKEPESTSAPETILETETASEPQLVVNQKEVEPVAASPEEEFYLVSETGYLLVFAQDQSTICLHTHIPISEFPEKEQEKLRAGIWFSSMMEIFHYLESYTS